MAKDNVTIYLILGLLKHESMTGYDIKGRIDGSISQFWNVGFSQIYPALKVMEKEGLVERQIEGGIKGPDRILYSITESGNKILMLWLEQPVSKEHLRYEIMLKLFFGKSVTVEENVARIKEFQGRYAKMLDGINMFEDNLKSIIQGTEDDHLYYYLTVLFGKEVYQAYLKWADKAIELLEQKGNE